MKNKSKDFYNATTIFPFQINAVFKLNVILIKKMQLGDHKINLSVFFLTVMCLFVCLFILWILIDS